MNVSCSMMTGQCGEENLNRFLELILEELVVGSLILFELLSKKLVFAFIQYIDFHGFNSDSQLGV